MILSLAFNFAAFCILSQVRTTIKTHKHVLFENCAALYQFIENGGSAAGKFKPSAVQLRNGRSRIWVFPFSSRAHAAANTAP